MLEDILQNRTFGLELEFSDAPKEKIYLKEGYKWTDNKFTTMCNSDGTRIHTNSSIGGEINTRPFKFCDDDLRELKEFLKMMKQAGASLLWYQGFDAHIYIKDLGLDFFKRLFAMSYYIAFPIKKIFDLPEWFETKYLVPSPSKDVLDKVLQAKNEKELLNCFKNGSARGYTRYWLNLVSLEKIGTVEFRIFLSTWDFEKTVETVKFMYSLIDYVYKNDNIDDYKKLNTVESCVSTFNINIKNTPKRLLPLLWAAEHDDATTVIGSMFKKSNRLLSHIKSQSSNHDVCRVVNSFFLDIEQIVTSRKIVLYTKEYFIFMVYEAIRGNVTGLKFSDDFKELNIEKGSPEQIVSTLYLFNSIKKHNKSEDVYHKGLYEDFIEKLDHYKQKYEERYKKLVEIIRSKDIEVKYGYDIIDALCDYQEGDLVVYQSEFHSGIKAAGNALYKHLVDDYGFKERKLTNYSYVDIEKVNYILISQHQYMGRTKVLKNDRTCLYSNVTKSGDNIFSSRKTTKLPYKRLPFDYEFNKNSKITFIKAKMSEIDYLRMIYLKKDIIMGSAPFCYLWFIDNYLFGATMMDFIPVKDYGMNAVTLKSDFVIDHPEKRLSKLLIMAVLSEEYKKELCVRFRSEIGVISTSVKTDKPVSMKYRGVFKLDKREAGKLIYIQESGIKGNLENVKNEYLKKFKDVKV